VKERERDRGRETEIDRLINLLAKQTNTDDTQTEQQFDRLPKKPKLI
jgi:hypothetical protein